MVVDPGVVIRRVSLFPLLVKGQKYFYAFPVAVSLFDPVGEQGIRPLFPLNDVLSHETEALVICSWFLPDFGTSGAVRV